MQYIGGLPVFRFAKLTEAVGALSRRCAVEFEPGKHAVFGDNDLIVHDGYHLESLGVRRMRKRIYNTIDSDFYTRSFAVHCPVVNEVWFCFPETGNALPNLAYVWNYREQTGGFRDLPLTSHIQAGPIDPGSAGEQWDGDSGSWDSDTSTWDQRLYEPSKLRPLLCDPNNTLLHLGNETTQFNGASFTATLERNALPFPLRADGPPDLSLRKHFKRIWPRITGTLGGTVNIYVAATDSPYESPMYGSALPYVIGTDRYVDCRVVGALLHLKIESTTAIEWHLPGYEVEFTARGRAR